MMQKQLKLFSWNVNGIRALEKKGFANWLQSCGADIVMLQETKCSPEQLSDGLCRPEGFYAEWCAGSRRYREHPRRPRAVWAIRATIAKGVCSLARSPGSSY